MAGTWHAGRAGSILPVRVERGHTAAPRIHLPGIPLHLVQRGHKRDACFFYHAYRLTLWVCEVTGGPFKFSPTKPGKTHLGLEKAHIDLKISPEEFDEVAAELGRSLDFAKVPAREEGEVLAAFAAHKKEVTAGYKTK